MKIINSYIVYLYHNSFISDIKKHIELCGRVCYKSEDRITDDSCTKFIYNLIQSGHTSVLEHGTIYLKMDCTKDPAEKYIENPYSFIYIENGIAYITTNYRVLVENNWIDDLKFISNCVYGKHIQRFSFRIVCSRAIANEFVRHRGFSFSQESTRYCNYNKSKFNNEITFIDSESLKDTNDFVRFLIHCSFKISEIVYKVLGKFKLSAQQMRDILPLATKTELIMTGTTEQWNEFFKLRCSKNAHPDARKLAEWIKEKIDYLNR